MVSKIIKAIRILFIKKGAYHLFRYGVAAGVEHISNLRNLIEVFTVVDIGANRGQFALVARHCWPETLIYSFEPLPTPAAVFKRIFVDDAKTHLFQSAIGEQSNVVTMHVSTSDDSSSLLPITVRQNQLFPGTSELRTQSVQVGRLADYLKDKDIVKPALLKLDVQGFELNALKGSEELLHHFEWVYAECSFVELYLGQALADEVLSWLHKREFELKGVYNMNYDRAGQSIQADFLFRRTN